MYKIELRRSVERILQKLSRKDPKQLGIILRKIEEIQAGPHHYKNLRKPLQHLKRVHIDSSFVLVFSVNEVEKTVIIEDYDHHDRIYKT